MVVAYAKDEVGKTYSKQTLENDVRQSSRVVIAFVLPEHLGRSLANPTRHLDPSSPTAVPAR